MRQLGAKTAAMFHKDTLKSIILAIYLPHSSLKKSLKNHRDTFVWYSIQKHTLITVWHLCRHLCQAGWEEDKQQGDKTVLSHIVLAEPPGWVMKLENIEGLHMLCIVAGVCMYIHIYNPDEAIDRYKLYDFAQGASPPPQELPRPN